MDMNVISGKSHLHSESYGKVDVKPVESTANINNSKDKSNKINEQVNALNKSLADQNAKYIIQRHEVFGDTMIKIVNKVSNEVLFEIPPEKFLDMIAKLCEISGLKIDKRA